jgi:lipid-binding SYLF domain-containing protein
MSLSGASIGIQIGAQSVGLVLVITNEAGLRAFTGGNSFKLGADVAVAAGPVGRDASAATDSRAKASIYSYSMSKGLFAGMSFEGSVLNQNRDANRAYWGRDLSAAAALKRPANDKRIKPLVDSLNILVKKAP